MLTRLVFDAANAAIAVAVTRNTLAIAKAKAVFIIAPFAQKILLIPQAVLVPQMCATSRSL